MTNSSYAQMAPSTAVAPGSPEANAPLGTHEDTISPEFEREIMRAKLMHSIGIIEAGSVGIEEDSIYGAAILMPQVARALGWPKEFVTRVALTYLYLLVTILVAGGLLTYLTKEEDVMDNFSGQPFLCEFAMGMEAEKSGPGGIGPGGTEITAPRLYNFDQWNSRVFARESLKAVFPEMAEKIDATVDAGEYGTESHSCKMMCILVFMMSILSEMDRVAAMFKLLWVVPNKNEDWIVLNDDSFDQSADQWIDHIDVRVAGMSIRWKLITFFTVFVPKTCLFVLTLTSGTTFLMESASIGTVIVNSTALGFLLNLDELIMSAVKTQAMESLLLKCEEYKLYDQEVKERIDRADQRGVVAEWNRVDASVGCFGFFCRLIPKQILIVLLLTALVVGNYYLSHCVRMTDGRWVSHDMHLPKELTFNWYNALMPFIFPVDENEKPWWTMPQPQED